MPNHTRPHRSSVEEGEIAQFSRHARDWWNTGGAFRSLHKLNPVRVAYVRDQILAQGLGQPSARQSLKGVSVLDVGCGGGLLSLPLARLGADVTGLDASKEGIAAARRQADAAGVKVDYHAGSAEEWAQGKKRYDVVTALEIVEHVADLDLFVASLAKLLKPKGLLILSTLNRTPKSFLLGVVAAEYILRWVPRGTHHWKQFVRPSELVRKLEANGISTIDLTGIVYRPLQDDFVTSKDNLNVNYMLAAVKS